METENLFDECRAEKAWLKANGWRRYLGRAGKATGWWVAPSGEFKTEADALAAARAGMGEGGGT